MRSLTPRTCDKRGTPRHSLADSGGEVALAYVGAVVPDEPHFHTVAFNPSGQMYQQELLLGLRRAGLPASLILSVLPIPAYPNGARIWIRGGEAYLPEGLRLTFIPFVNIFLFKQITIGIVTLMHLLFWRWRTRHASFRIVYTYNLTVPPGLLTLLGVRIIGAKAVVSLCDINVPGETAPLGWPWQLDYWLQRKLIPHFDGHVTVADAIAREFIPGRPYLRLEGGVRTEKLAKHRDPSIVKENLGAAFVITATGTLNEANGVPILLKAFSLLEGDRYRLCIAGRGPLEELVREAAATDPRIEYLGFISPLEVLRVYQRSDLLVNMRVTGSINTKYFFPGKMMEYLASGAPVITTCTGHTEEEFADFVFLLRDETPQGLVALIRQVANLDSGERRRVGEKAQQYIALNKTWDVQASNAVRFIREVVLGIDVLPSDQSYSSQDPVDSIHTPEFVNPQKVASK
jgi:glycosyltransferase involved in cell wall biosynthesis